MEIGERVRDDVAHICEIRGAKEAHALADDNSNDVWIQLKMDGFEDSYNNNITVEQFKKVLRVMEGLEDAYKCPVTVSWSGVRVEMTVCMNENSPIPESVRKIKEEDVRLREQKEKDMRGEIESYLMDLKEKGTERIDVLVMSLELHLPYDDVRKIVFEMNDEGVLSLG